MMKVRQRKPGKVYDNSQAGYSKGCGGVRHRPGRCMLEARECVEKARDIMAKAGMSGRCVTKAREVCGKR